MTEQPASQEPKYQMGKKQSNKKLTLLIIFLVAVLGVFIYMIHQNIEAVEKVTVPKQVSTPSAKPAQPEKPTKPEPKVDKDSLAKAQEAQKADSIKVKPQKPEAQKPDAAKDKPQKPETKKPDATKDKPQKPEAQKPAKEKRPKTHRMQKGESLTRISQKYYGTKDSVRAILRINTFANPDNIPVGAVVKLP